MNIKSIKRPILVGISLLLLAVFAIVFAKHAAAYERQYYGSWSNGSCRVVSVDGHWVFQCYTPSPTPTGTPKPSVSPSATPTPSPTVKPSPSVSPSPSPSVSPSPSSNPTSSGLCMNYGHQAYTYDLNGQVSSDLTVMSNAKINCIRLSYMGWNNAQSEALAVFAKSRGFRVIIGGDWGTLGLSQYASYDSQVLTEAKWAQANNIDQLSLGNEQEYRLSGISQAQWAAHLSGLAAQVKAVYSGKVSYETSTDFESGWISSGIGNIDLLGWNSYCGYACNAGRLQNAITAFGASHVYVSETDADQGTWSTDAQHAAEVTGDAVKLESFGVPIYYFAFAACNNTNGVASSWGLYQCGTLAQPLTAQALGL